MAFTKQIPSVTPLLVPSSSTVLVMFTKPRRLGISNQRCSVSAFILRAEDNKTAPNCNWFIPADQSFCFWRYASDRRRQRRRAPQASGHGTGGRGGNHQGQIGLRSVGADFLRRVRWTPSKACPGENHWRMTNYFPASPVEPANAPWIETINRVCLEMPGLKRRSLCARLR